MNPALRDLAALVFDLDGTLVRSDHDYPALKRRLGLPGGLAILEGIATLPPERRLRCLAEVDRWEQDHARAATALEGARDTLSALRSAGRPIGILTRNTHATALATLRAAGLDGLFEPHDVLGRDEAPPKPSPDGILALLRRWNVAASRAAMVGDFRFDLVAGRAAGVLAVGYDPGATGSLDEHADVVIRALAELTAAAGP